MSANQHVFSHGMRDTREAFETWRERPWPVLGGWLALSVAIAVTLLFAVWFVAGLLTPDLTPVHLPGITEPSAPADLLPILERNALVLAFHATACVAGFIAGASMPIAAAQRSGFSRWVHVKAGELAILFVCAVTVFSLSTQAFYLGFQGSTLAFQLHISRAVLILSVLPHAIPTLRAVLAPGRLADSKPSRSVGSASRRHLHHRCVGDSNPPGFSDNRGLRLAAHPRGPLSGRLRRSPPVSGYDPRRIEEKWQRVWAEERTWEVANPGAPGFQGSKPKSYVLEMLPYPSGEPHVGHLKVYAVGDAIAHFRRRRGFEVIHPMGYDSFGLPAENNAIKTGEPPREATERSIDSFRQQFREWGISIDWSRELATHLPDYYRWTQWIFLQLLARGLAYRAEAPVQWCPTDATVLANEQVIDGRCERCGTPVVQRKLEQWFFAITEYAERLLADFDLLESWPEHVITMQRNWIGRSEGAEVVFRCEEIDLDFPVFTTRPDTLFGATFFVLAPEHPALERLVAGTAAEPAVREYVDRVTRESAEERGAEDREKTGVALGRSVLNPVNGELIPMFVADYVLMEYGTGAIMAVPAHDVRDYEFALAFDLPIRRVIDGVDAAAAREEDGLPYPGDGPMLSSGRFDGRGNREAHAEIVEWLAAERRGRPAVNYRLRDWLVSRQRYWGAPIPVIHCEACGIVAVPEDLPGRTARGRGLRAAGAQPARRGRGLGQHPLPAMRRSCPA